MSNNKKKIYVLDTNVLLNDPMSTLAFMENKVILCMTVLEELDVIKDKSEKSVSREARIAINIIEGVIAEASPEELKGGVVIENSNASGEKGVLIIFPDQLKESTHGETPKLRVLDTNNWVNNDNRIINTALDAQEKNPDNEVHLVTKDINMRIKAKAAGLLFVEDYKNDHVIDDIDLLPSGYMNVKGSLFDNVVARDCRQVKGKTISTIDRDSIEMDMYFNQFILDENDFVGQVIDFNQSKIKLSGLNRESLMKQVFWGIKPRNIEQAMAFSLMNNPDLDLVCLSGPAGSGKTLIAFAYALDAVFKQNLYDRIIISRNTPTLAEDQGFLPGTEPEKMMPWLAAFTDSLEFLHANDESPELSGEHIMNSGKVQFRSLNYMRGRSIHRSIFILDESQSLTQFQTKSIVTRQAQDGLLIVLGNNKQIDSNYLTPQTSGFTYLINKMKNFQHSGVVHITGVERSRLAAYAEENM